MIAVSELAQAQRKVQAAESRVSSVSWSACASATK